MRAAGSCEVPKRRVPTMCKPGRERTHGILDPHEPRRRQPARHPGARTPMASQKNSNQQPDPSRERKRRGTGGKGGGRHAAASGDRRVGDRRRMKPERTARIPGRGSARARTAHAPSWTHAGAAPGSACPTAAARAQAGGVAGPLRRAHRTQPLGCDRGPHRRHGRDRWRYRGHPLLHARSGTRR